MLDITVLILTKNEEKNLPKCIRSFGNIVRRFVVVDSFSDDQTEEVCIALGNEVAAYGGQLSFYQHEWKTYADQFNWGLDATEIQTCWVMRMDADEEITPELRNELNERLPVLSDNICGIVLKRRVYFMGKWLRHGGKYPEYLLRVIKMGKGRCEQRMMDEHLYLSEGQTVTFQYDMIDRNTKDLSWWINKHNWYSDREALDCWQLRGEAVVTYGDKRKDSIRVEAAGNSGYMTNLSKYRTSKQAKRKRIIKEKGYYRLPKFFRAHLYFIYRYYLRFGFLDGTEGKIYTFLQAYWYRFLVDAKMYERERQY